MIQNLLVVAATSWAIGDGLILAKPEFMIGHDNAMSTMPRLSLMADELALDLEKRADFRIDSMKESLAVRLTCVIQDVKVSTTVFQGSTCKAWNTRGGACPVTIASHPQTKCRRGTLRTSIDCAALRASLACTRRFIEAWRRRLSIKVMRN